MTASLSAEQSAALVHARHLADHGVPIFLARPALDTDGDWAPGGGLGGTGYLIPRGWQDAEPDPTVVDRWRPGMAICAVMGHETALLDMDPKNGGEASLAELGRQGLIPTTYGHQTTPSGGLHYFTATLGVRSRDGLLPGIDIKDGTPEGEGRGFGFIAPTRKLSKATGEIGEYAWLVPPDLESLELVGPDGTQVRLRDLVAEVRGGGGYAGPDYDGAAYADLTSAQKTQAQRFVASRIKYWTGLLNDAAEWPDGETDEKGRGWEALSKDCAWSFAVLASWPWTGVDELDAERLFSEVMPEAIAENPRCSDKYSYGLVEKACRRPVEPPPWEGEEAWETAAEASKSDDPEHSDATDGLVETSPRTARWSRVEVTNPASALQWLLNEVGTNGLSGMFVRGIELVYTPRVGEAGYVAPRDGDDGPAQVRRVTPQQLAARLDQRYYLYAAKRDADGIVTAKARALFPSEAAGRAIAIAELLPNARILKGVTHTPTMREDGSVLAVPGYDEDSGLLYLPEPGLVVRDVPEAPTDEEVAAARGMIELMVCDFPWVTIHDRANYIGLLLTPLLKLVAPPPYKMVLIGAPQRGSGKSLLGLLPRVLHGGVFRASFPTDEPELRKSITALLDTTSAPVVQFDNVNGVIKSPVLDGLLTSRVWSDRELGTGKVLDLANDRVWIATGNNVHIGGDLARRVTWVTIDAHTESPELRSGFAIADLEGWVTENRGELLWSLLVLVRRWVVEGMDVGELPTSDSFGYMTGVLRAILSTCGIEGVVGHADSVQSEVDEEAEEWARFLAAVHEVYGEDVEWACSDVLSRAAMEDGITAEDLPHDIADKLGRAGHAAAGKALGWWLRNRRNRWEGGYSAQSRPGKNKKDGQKWRVISSAREELI